MRHHINFTSSNVIRSQSKVAEVKRLGQLTFAIMG